MVLMGMFSLNYFRHYAETFLNQSPRNCYRRWNVDPTRLFTMMCSDLGCSQVVCF
ncbi:hypothetical protein DPMN_183973 [Dreissena polymorpha]|uniref:Uncharacterized protein n=1 Tax=Dreissena polymorpha TaxID=45954 RepID=A0A9D4DJ40_DREPO|nr:hypothetical protein DPMN_183973 [Dreissena polymorpha]